MRWNVVKVWWNASAVKRNVVKVWLNMPKKSGIKEEWNKRRAGSSLPILKAKSLSVLKGIFSFSYEYFKDDIHPFWAKF
ncbi:hypothetical protein [Flavobacterium soli]|uniref:hypothetical protein n=1 Tax=Flavobacterium soli TaxID=344881 RepID=UPI00047C8897|nr:hypothetical protein [Flavobacterium soli]